MRVPVKCPFCEQEFAAKIPLRDGRIAEGGGVCVVQCENPKCLKMLEVEKPKPKK